MTNIGRLRELSSRERRLLASAFVSLPIVALGLRMLGFTRLRGLLSRHSSPQTNNSESARSVAQMVRIAADHGLIAANCLERSLTLWWLLARRGIESDLRIGVRTASGQFEAHAWVERDGIALNDSKDVSHRYSPFDWTQLPVNTKFN